MKQKLITILVAFGIAQAEAEKYLEKVDHADVETLDPAKLTEALINKQKELLKNDSAFVGEIQKAEALKRNDMFLQKLKQKTGLTAEELKAAGYETFDPTKNLAEIIDLAVGKIRKKGDLTSEQLQQENVTLQAEIKKLKDEVIPEIEKRGDSIKRDLTLASLQEKMLGKLPKKLRVGEVAALATINAKLSERGIKAELDDTGKLVYKTTDGLLVKSKDGTKLLNAEEIVIEILDEEKLLENSGAPAGDKGQGITTKLEKDDQEKLFEKFPHLKKAHEHSEKVKADMVANKD